MAMRVQVCIWQLLKYVHPALNRAKCNTAALQSMCSLYQASLQSTCRPLGRRCELRRRLADSQWSSSGDIKKSFSDMSR